MKLELVLVPLIEFVHHARHVLLDRLMLLPFVLPLSTRFVLHVHQLVVRPANMNHLHVTVLPIEFVLLVSLVHQA